MTGRTNSPRGAHAATGHATIRPLPSEGGLARFYKKDGSISVARITSGLGLSRRQLAGILGLEVSGPSQDTAAVRARAAEMVEIVHRVRAWAGGETQAIAWYKAEPLAGFGGRTAESLVKEGKAAAVRDYLDHVATGGFA